MTRRLLLAVVVGSTACTVHVGPSVRPTSAPRTAEVAPTPKASPPRGPLIAAMGPRRPRTAPAARPGDSSELAQLCVDEINRYRATLGLHPLQRAADREACADGQIADDARTGHWHGRFGACGESAQNECNASPTDRAQMIKGCLRGMWGEGPGGGHYENMKSATATRVWCGFHTTPSGDVWSVQDFR